MIEDLNRHIEPGALAKLMEDSRSEESTLDALEMHPHLAVCSTCREQFAELAALDRQLKGLRPAEPVRRQSAHNDCPATPVWREIFIAPTQADETLIYLEHASRCDYCGPLLHQAIAEFAELNRELNERERLHIAALESASLEWQQRLARQIAETQIAETQFAETQFAEKQFAGTSQPAPHRDPAPWSQSWQRWMTVPRLAVAGASLLAVVAVGSWSLFHQSQLLQALHPDQQSRAAGLLASAYTEKRTLEVRIAHAGYAPLRVSLGPAASFTSRPAALLKAEALIATQLESHPTDPVWLQSKAQADVLEGKYDAAVEALRHALEFDPHSASLLTDLATAYFQRAQQEDRKDDLGAAYEYLSQALQLQPDDPVALFNRAIVAEHQFLYHQALDDWEHYLRLDSSSQWAEEARNRASAVREKLNQHSGNEKPLLFPAQLSAVATNPSMALEVDERIEEYLHEAVRSWLPQAFPEFGTNVGKASPDPYARQALFFLADLTTRQHSDHWLDDLLRASSAPNFPQAATALARAVQANDAGEYEVSRQQAELAEKLFRASGNTAGVLRAEFEQSFADQVSRRSEDCRRRSIAAGAEAKRYSYPWVQIQLGLEESVCSGLMGDLGADERSARRAMERAQQSGYEALYLRALGFVAGEQRDTGNAPEGWRLVSAGLNRYWSGQFPAMRGYNFYTELAFMVGAAARPELQLALRREAVALVDADEQLLLRAWAHSSMARAAIEAHQPEVAEHNYEEAARLYGLAPQTGAARAYRLEDEIRTAQLEALKTAFGAALARLTRVEDEVRQLSNNYLAEIFYSTMGEVQLRGHHPAEAESAYQAAIRLAEQNLASLTSEESRTSWSKDAAPAYLGLAEAELVQRHEQESLDVFEWYLGAPQRVGVNGRATSKTASEASQSLPDPSQLPARLPLLTNQTVLAYGLLPDGLAIWVYDNRGVSAKWIPTSPQELQDWADSFYARCSDPSSDLPALRRDSQALYSLLIAPVEERLDPKRTLTIETEGFLDRLPFEALLDANGHYLLERGPIVHSPGPYAQARMNAEAAISPALPALVVGSAASLPETGVFAAPNLLAGADAVAGRFRSPRVLKGSEATLSAVKRALPAAAVFHFAGHALTIPSDTGLMLEGKDVRTGAPILLDAAVVRHLHLQNTQLAVLAACSTDSGEGGSRGFGSVAEALQTSGVPHVVASRWAVDAVESSAFMDSFYPSLLSGQPVSAATRETSQAMLLNPQTAHPYHWAAFAAYGRR